MRTRTKQAGTTAVDTIRELGEALASEPFRAALALSALLHLALLLGLRGVEAVPPSRPPVRLHFIREEPAPPATPPRQPADSAVAAPAPAPATLAPVPTPAAAPSPPAPASPVVEPAAPEEQPAPLPATNAEMLPEAPRAPEEARTVAELSEPAPPAASLRQAADGGTAFGSAAPDAHAGSGASGRQEEGMAAADTIAPVAAGVPGVAGGGEAGAAAAASAPPGPAPAGAPSQASGPSAQEIATLRRRIDARKVYPQIAIRNGWEGRVLVEMHLDVEGRLAAVRLVAGSGYSILDEATITAVRLASPFPPIARVVTVPVEYRLIP